MPRTASAVVVGSTYAIRVISRHTIPYGIRFHTVSRIILSRGPAQGTGRGDREGGEGDLGRYGVEDELLDRQAGLVGDHGEPEPSEGMTSTVRRIAVPGRIVGCSSGFSPRYSWDGRRSYLN
jgi:hypothetical protein